MVQIDHSLTVDGFLEHTLSSLEVVCHFCDEVVRWLRPTLDFGTPRNQGAWGTLPAANYTQGPVRGPKTK